LILYVHSEILFSSGSKIFAVGNPIVRQSCFPDCTIQEIFWYIIFFYSLIFSNSASKFNPETANQALILATTCSSLLQVRSQKITGVSYIVLRFITHLAVSLQT
jgi:hypothetical protein